MKANYLASPPLVVAYALAGRMDIDLTTEPIGQDPDGNDVYLRDLWPTSEEIDDDDRRLRLRRAVPRTLRRRLHRRRALARARQCPSGDLYAWDRDSTYVRRPPYFDGMPLEPPDGRGHRTARAASCMLGDSVTTDHISPAGSIKPDSPAGHYLVEHGVERQRLQLVRLAPRQPRGDGARDVRERAPAQPARARAARARGRCTCRAARRDRSSTSRERYLRRGHAADRPRRQGVRHGLVARLGGEGPEAARRPRGDRRELRADPPLEPADDGRAPAPVSATARTPSRSGSPAARCSRSAASTTPRRREVTVRADDKDVHRPRAPRHAARARVPPARRHPPLRADDDSCETSQNLRHGRRAGGALSTTGIARHAPSSRSTRVLQRIVEAAAELTGAKYAALGVIDRVRPRARALPHDRHRRGDARADRRPPARPRHPRRADPTTPSRCGCTT